MNGALEYLEQKNNDVAEMNELMRKIKKDSDLSCGEMEKKFHDSINVAKKEFEDSNPENEVKPVSSCWGITNRCFDDKYVLFADFDKIYFHILTERLKRLLEKFPDRFTNFLILASSEPIQTSNGVLGSFHVVSFGKMNFEELAETLALLPVDDQFRLSLKTTPYRTNTLRLSPKYKWKEKGKPDEVLKDAPRFVCWFPQPEVLHPKEISEAHLKAYKKVLGISRFALWKTDENSHIEVKKYDSAKG